MGNRRGWYRERRVAPGSCKSPSPSVSPVSEEGGGNSLGGCISANCCCCIYCWRLPGRYSNDCRERTAAARDSPGSGKLGQAPGIGGGGGAQASQRPPRGPRELPADARSSQAREQSGWRRRPRPRPYAHAARLAHLRRGHLPAGALEGARRGEEGLKPPRPPHLPADPPPPAPSSLLTPRSAAASVGSPDPLRSLLSSPLSAPHPLSLSPLLSLGSSAAPALFFLPAGSYSHTAAAAREVGRRVG